MKRGLFDDPYAHLPGEQPCKDLEHDDLVELYGYDEERGLSKIVIKKGTEIEIPLEDEYGAITWIAGRVTSTQSGTLDLQVTFPGSVIDSAPGHRHEAEPKWKSHGDFPPALRRR